MTSREYFLCAKKMSNGFIQQFILFRVSPQRVFTRVPRRVSHFFYKVCEENNCWIAIIFVFVAHRKYSRSFIKLQLDHWWHMDCFIDVLTTFLGLEYGSCIAVYAGSESSNLCSEDEWKSCGFGTTWGWVINDRFFIFGWTNPLNDTCCIFHGH